MSCAAAYKDLLKAAKPYPALTDIIKTHGPIEIPDSSHEGSDLHLARAITGQQLSVKAARSIWNRVVAFADTRGCKVMDVCATEMTEELRACGLSYSKIRALCAIHQHYEAHGLNDQVLAAMPHEERVKNLIQIWGVGQWTVEMLSLFYFRDPDIWSVGDGGLQRGMNRIQRQKLTLKEMAGAADEFRPWRSYLSLYLWRLIETPDIL